MSFILDALRKSEHERQRQTGPGIADLTPAAAQTRFPIWALALGALLVVNIAVVLVLVLRGETGPPSTAVTQVASSQPIAPAAPMTDPATRPAPAQRDAAPPAAVPRANAGFDRPSPQLDESATADAGLDAEQDPIDPTRERADRELVAAVRAATASETTTDENLPTLNDVTLQGAGHIPELHLDIHVFATTPAERFVFINMRKYREGGKTPEGTLIERITRDGVVLNHRGVRFLLPRQ